MSKSKPRIGELDDLCGVYTAPWVSGTRARHYYGPVSVEDYYIYPAMPDAKALDRIIDALQRKAYSLGANAVVGVEIQIDPFADDQDHGKGFRFYASGTAAALEPLF